MVLKSLEIQGFKSFPDRTTLNFGKGITAVVGPNGSGKSNISDAVRWVLGETSSKSLRGSKMEDVIFSGTSARKALGFAQVQLTLDNTDQTLKDKGEVVTVSRRYYRSGESEYKIDGETVRARDIRELFMDTGLGSDGYSMVGQGKIDSIISQKNEDRRELFEEAAGILSRGNMIDELNSEAEKLEKQAKEIKAEYKTALEEANFALAALQGAQADLQQAKEELIRAQGEHKLVAEKYDLLSSQLSVLVNEKDSAKQRIAEFENEAKSCEVEIKSIEDEISKTESELEKTSGNASELNAKRDEYREKSEKINLELVTLAKDNEAAKLSVEELNFRKNSQFDRVKTIEDEIKSIEEKNQALLISINEIKASANDLRVKAEQSDKDVSEQINQRNELEKRTTELRGEEKIKNQDREKLSGSIVRLDERKIAMKKEYDELNDMLFEQYELTKHEAEALDIQIEDMTAAKRRLHEIKVAIKSLGSINVGAIEEYKEVSERYTFLKEQIGDVEKSKSELMKIIEDLTASMSEKFLTQFNKINEEFKVCFADFFGGGKGELVLEEPDNCLESPIEIRIQPPGKSVQNINLFSGGEKSLAAMALLFSVLKVQPAPFCIYDEVEAALDDVNVERFAKYMRKMTDKTQFISITHRRGTMEEADVLYGVTMQEKGVSKLIELQTAELAAKMGLE